MRTNREPAGQPPDLERRREEPPTTQVLVHALYGCGCTSVHGYETLAIGTHSDGSTIRAARYPGGWLVTGGPLNLLSYGVPDASALERFPAVLASIQQHARSILSPRGGT